MTANSLVKSKLDEFFWEWLALPESQRIISKKVKFAKGEVGSRHELDRFPSPQFAPRSRTSPSSSSGGSSPSSGLSSRKVPVIYENSSVSSSFDVSSTGSSAGTSVAACGTQLESSKFTRAIAITSKLDFNRPSVDVSSIRDSAGIGLKVIPRFWWPKQHCPDQVLPEPLRQQIHDAYVKQGVTELKTHQQLEPIVTEVPGLSKYFTIPIFHKIQVFYGIVDSFAKSKQSLMAPSPVPITEQMLVGWCRGKIQIDDPVLTFLYVVKSEHNQWIEREDFNVFLMAILISHPGLDFLSDTYEFQDRYADTVISRIFFVFDRKDVGRIYLCDLRTYEPSIIETWKQLAKHDDIKMVRDYFSYEHFYVIYCTFWELDSDHDFLLDKDDLLKYDGHAFSRRAIDRIFSEIPAKFSSAVPGRMGYEDFIRFLLCDQDRSTDRSVEYWFQVFDLDGDGVIRTHEMNYFHEEQAQRMECLNYESISFGDIMCQMNDMISPKIEGEFRLNDFKRRRKFAGTFFSLFSSLNKFLAFEHRDPFQSKQEQLDNPNFNEWDRWCGGEYLRLAMEERDEQEDAGTRNDVFFADEVAPHRARRVGGDSYLDRASPKKPTSMSL